jgi:hypothetical protein
MAQGNERFYHPQIGMCEVIRDDPEPYDPSEFCCLSACKDEGCTRRTEMCLSKYPTQAARNAAAPK